MRIIVTGDRAWHCYDLADSILARLIARYGPSITIVHGDATGVDRSFAVACGEHDIEQESHPARWEVLDVPGAVIRHDKRGRPYNANAGPIRNAEMVALGAELCIALHRSIESSKGTRDCVARAIEAGIPTYLIDSEEAIPKRLRK